MNMYWLELNAKIQVICKMVGGAAIILTIVLGVVEQIRKK